MAEITVTVDGVKYADHVEPRMLLVYYLREVVGKTGTPVGCDTSNCGACTVLLDGQSVKGCSVLAVQADGAEITTIQGLAKGGLHPLQRAFHEEHALQCGQSLLPLLRLRLAYPDLLVDVGSLGELRGVTDAGDSLVIGARTTHYQLVRDPLVAEHRGLLAQAAATVGPAVRHRGTLGGSLAHADPAGDLPAVALALDATMVARSPRGEREIAAADFFTDYLTSSLEPDEILTAVRVPKLGAGWGYRYEKFHRTAQAWATVGVAALVRRSNGSVTEARIGLANMGPTPLRAAAAESAAAGAQASRDALRAAAASADDGTNPPGDLHGAPDYRRHLARVLTGRALAAAAGA